MWHRICFLRRHFFRICSMVTIFSHVFLNVNCLCRPRLNQFRSCYFQLMFLCLLNAVLISKLRLSLSFSQTVKTYAMYIFRISTTRPVLIKINPGFLLAYHLTFLVHNKLFTSMQYYYFLHEIWFPFQIGASHCTSGCLSIFVMGYSRLHACSKSFIGDLRLQGSLQSRSRPGAICWGLS